MAPDDEMDVELLMILGEQAGLHLEEAEAAKVLNGVKRNRQMADAVRRLVSPDLEPAPVFTAAPPAGRKE